MPAVEVPVWRAFAGWVLEITADGLLHFFARAQQPKDDEERHHGRDEIGVSHFPSPAMLVIVMAGFFANDDDGLDALFSRSSSRLRREQRRRVSGTPYPFPGRSA